MFKLEHFQRYIGFEVMIKVRQPIDKRRKFTGKLMEVRSDEMHKGVVVIAEENEMRMIPIVDILKANLVM